MRCHGRSNVTSGKSIRSLLVESLNFCDNLMNQRSAITALVLMAITLLVNIAGTWVIRRTTVHVGGAKK